MTIPNPSAGGRLDARLGKMERVVSCLRRTRLSRTAFLFGNEAIDHAPADATVPPERAARLTQRFLTYYHHAVPFDSDVIRFMWNHCYGAPCGEGGPLAAEQLGFSYEPITGTKGIAR